MTKLKDWLLGVAAAFVALLLAFIGVQRNTIMKQRAEADRLEKEEAEARVAELNRREAAKAKAAEDARLRRQEAHDNIRQGRRNYFEQD